MSMGRRDEMNGNSRIVVCLAALLAAAAAGAAQSGWSWEMPADVYKGVDFSNRTAVDRATRIFRQAWDARNGSSLDTIPRFRAAQAEWKKVQVQCETQTYDERLLAYCQFMQGFSLMNARDRNEAIRLFNEVLDLYADEGWIACPATYWLGRTYLGMGESRRGLEELQKVAETAAYEKSPLWASANMFLADSRWGSGESGAEEEAAERWARVNTSLFREIARDDWTRARDNLKWYAFAKGDWGAFEDLLFAGLAAGDAKGRAQRMTGAWREICAQLDNHGLMVRSHFNRTIKKEKERADRIAQVRRAAAEWVDRGEQTFREAGMAFEFDMFALDVWGTVEGADKQLKRIRGILGRIASAADARTRESRYRAVAMKLCEWRKFDEARTVAESVTSPRARLYLLADIESSAGAWAKVIKALDEILSSKPEAAEERALKKRIASVCHDRTGDYPRAIRLWLEIAEPPGTLWRLQDAYRRNGEKQKSYVTLVEIQSLFPPEAPAAVYTQAQYYEQDGDKKKAIALYRRLLSQPEWKQTPQSSQAHQQLERLGVATGGAMTNAVR